LRVFTHFGAMGCYKHTPPQVVLAWFNDTLDAIGELDSISHGWHRGLNDVAADAA